MPRSRKPAQPDKLQALIVDEMLNTMTPFVSGWLRTLGEAGKPNSKVAPHIRTKAAMDGLNFFTRLQEIKTDGAGAQDLLRELTKLETGANDIDIDLGEEEDRFTDAERATEEFPLE